METQKTKTIRVVMRNGKMYMGKLVGFDGEANLLLEELVLIDEGKRERIGKAILNGDAVALIHACAK
jgi:small nuclear ribonucleoprotein (snRNP)-like protein